MIKVNPNHIDKPLSIPHGFNKKLIKNIKAWCKRKGMSYEDNFNPKLKKYSK